MAAVASPYGLRPSKIIGDENNTGGMATYPIASGAAFDLKVGDMVQYLTGGTLTKYVGTTTAPAFGILGVFMGVEYEDVNMGFVTKQQWVSGTVTKGAKAAKALIVDNPFQVFEAQANGSLTQTALGANVAVVQGTGNLTLGTSGVSLNAGSAAVTATLPLRIVGFVDKQGFSVVGDAFTDCLVRINLPTHLSATGSV